MKEKIEQANEGVFMRFEELGKNGKKYAYKFDRDKTRNAILGIKLVKKNLIYVKNSGDFFEVANRKKAELLGIIYYHKFWKSLVWEQCEGIILAPNCLKELLDFIKELENLEINSPKKQEDTAKVLSQTSKPKVEPASADTSEKKCDFLLQNGKCNSKYYKNRKCNKRLCPWKYGGSFAMAVVDNVNRIKGKK